MSQSYSDLILARVKCFVRGNWGAPFVVGFIVLLVFAAVSLSLGLSSLADTIAIYSYYALAAGVVLQLFYFLRHRGKSDEEID